MDKILDIVDDDVAHHSDIEDHGLLGSTVLGDRVTELLERPGGDPLGGRRVLRRRLDTIDALDASDLVGALR